jgi:UDP-2,3-diacylglucosamine hydrolase
VLSIHKLSLLVSDVHLCEERPAQVERFIALLEGPARRADSLFVLGDLFEYWVGDEDCSSPLPHKVIAAFSALAGSGCKTYFVCGNRDFLIGQEFATQAGMTCLDDPCVVDLQGTSTILMHGDLLCTDDTAYLAFREQVRNPNWQQQFLAQPLTVRHHIARGATVESGKAKQAKTEQIMDVTETAVAKVFQQFGVKRLIHGHTHRPAYHQHLVDGELKERWVLPDWYGPGGYLQVTPSKIEEIRFSE